MSKEVRFSKIEYRKDGDSPRMVGHAAVFNTRTSIGGWYYEVIEPGAFKDALKTSDVRALFNHDSNYVLGRSTAGTLRLSEDATGLLSEIDPPDTQFSRDLQEQMRRGDISQMSFAFTVKDQRWEKKDGADLRVIERVSTLYDVSVVTYPAYPDATVALRSKEVYDEFKAERLRSEHPLVVPVSLMRLRLDLASRS